MMTKKLLTAVVTAAAIAAAALLTPQPAGAAGSPPRYAYANQVGDTLVVTNVGPRSASVSDTATGASGVAGSWSQNPAVLTEPASSCGFRWVWVSWAGSGSKAYDWYFCGSGATA
jgi:hypothetical protein